MRRRILVSGVVQGVGFRYFVLRTAKALGVDGWVKNLHNGDVLCEAQASSEIMDEFLAQLREGPSFSRVEKLAVGEIEPLSEPPSGFAIR